MRQPCKCQEEMEQYERTYLHIRNINNKGNISDNEDFWNEDEEQGHSVCNTKATLKNEKADSKWTQKYWNDFTYRCFDSMIPAKFSG